MPSTPLNASGMTLPTHTSPELLVHKCPVQICRRAPMRSGGAARRRAAAKRTLACGFIDKQLGAGARFVCIQPR